MIPVKSQRFIKRNRGKKVKKYQSEMFDDTGKTDSREKIKVSIVLALKTKRRDHTQKKVTSRHCKCETHPHVPEGSSHIVWFRILMAESGI